MNSWETYRQDVLKFGLPLSLGGGVAYLNGLADITIASQHSVTLVAAIGLGALLISVLMSPLMSILSANQALFAKIQTPSSEPASQEKQTAFVWAALSQAGLLGWLFFLLADPLTVFFGKQLLQVDHGHVQQWVASFMGVAKYSLLFVPIVFAIKGLSKWHWSINCHPQNYLAGKRD